MAQKPLNFSEGRSVIFAFTDCAFGVMSKNLSLSPQIPKNSSSEFLCEFHMFTRTSLIHFELMFIYNMRFIFRPVGV